ncbi:DUF418 domain-containing protein [Paenibacillus lutrae]|uniref:DUF418 domain-containing protein n=1 Tax=Paenibacillus lutrae TaxID=2078573 RepID=A0A7X3JYG7_9BACL|nr:DUF418 domain-containing protein [Paenibacillus lutrae]MVO98929.1 DUF418 domain-containing protein [Paenibacillus lutrae]
MIGPAAGKERIISVDIIRGFALLGIFLVNMPTFSGSEFLTYDGADRYIRMFFDLFVQGKFYLIFSFLFGLGFYLFMSRAEQKGFGKSLFFRRLLILLVIGLAHLIFLWKGDILTLYALTGLLLPAFYPMRTEALWFWGRLLVIGYLLLTLGLSALVVLVDALLAGRINPAFGGSLFTASEIQSALHAFQTLPWSEWLAWHWQVEVFESLGNQLTMLPIILGMFLLGLAVGKSGMLQNVEAHRTQWERIRRRNLAASVPLLACIAAIYAFGEESSLSAVVYFITYISGYTLAFVYISQLALLLHKPVWQRRLRFLQPYGRMALTNYLTQTVLCTVLFLGFRLYGHVNIWQGTLICLAIYPVQIAFSAFWLRHFRYGPAEWVWRRLTYAGTANKPGKQQS